MLWHDDLQSGKHLPAIIDLARKAITLRPDIANNWYMLVSFLLQAGEDEEATAVLTEALSKLPSDPKLCVMLARAHHRAGRVDLLREVLQAAPAIPIDDRETTISRCELIMKSRTADDEARIAVDTLALDPLNAHALLVLGTVSRNNGRPQIMIPFCQAALEQDPGHSRARYELAVAFAMLGRSEQARQLLDLDRFVKVIDLAPPDSYATAERIRDRPCQRDCLQSDAETRSCRSSNKRRLSDEWPSPAERPRSWHSARFDTVGGRWIRGKLTRRPHRSFCDRTAQACLAPCLGGRLSQ